MDVGCSLELVDHNLGRFGPRDLHAPALNAGLPQVATATELRHVKAILALPAIRGIAADADSAAGLLSGTHPAATGPTPLLSVLARVARAVPALAAQVERLAHAVGHVADVHRAVGQHPLHNRRIPQRIHWPIDLDRRADQLGRMHACWIEKLLEARDREGGLVCTRKVAEGLCGQARAERHLCTERLAALAAHQLHVKEATRSRSRAGAGRCTRRGLKDETLSLSLRARTRRALVELIGAVAPCAFELLLWRLARGKLSVRVLLALEGERP